MVVRTIQIEGNTRTRHHIITRELNIHPGDTIDLALLPMLLQQERNKIFNTRLFVTVDVKAAPALPDSLPQYLERDVIILLKERWYFFPSVIFELADRNFNEWWEQRGRDLSRTNYGIRLSQRNFRGRNERLKLKLQGGFTKKYELLYEVPYLNRQQKAGGSVMFSYITQKNVAFDVKDHTLEFLGSSDETLLTRFTTGLTYGRRHGFFTNSAFSLQFVYNTIADTLAELNPNYFLNGRTHQRYFQASYRFDWDRRDIKAYALRGHQLWVTLGRAGLLPSDDFHRTSITALGALYRPLGHQFYWSGSVSGQLTTRARQPFAQFQALGYGQELVRGYNRYVINGQHYGLLRNTLRKRLFSYQTDLNFIPLRQFRTIPVALYIKGFSDLGYVYNPLATEQNARFTNQPLWGTGLGLDLVTFYDAVFRIEWAINAQAETGFFLNFRSEF